MGPGVPESDKDRPAQKMEHIVMHPLLVSPDNINDNNNNNKSNNNNNNNNNNNSYNNNCLPLPWTPPSALSFPSLCRERPSGRLTVASLHEERKV